MNALLTPFDDIRPFEPEELPEVYDRLLANPQFHAVVNFLYPQAPIEAVAQKMRACKTNLDFQLAFCYDFIKGVLAKAARGYEMDCTAIDVNGRYTFVSNHRDIVLDPGILDVLLMDAGFTTTCEIAIGDNLLSLPWVKDLARVNKCFIVKRGLPLREMLMASKQMSEYMHLALTEKHENVWIAQRSGRAKDSDDRTSEAVLKMMVMGGKGTIVERLKELRIVPLSISYEYDPCDFLKAQEFQQKRDIPNWKKGEADDLVSMQTGIFGFKGHVHYHCAPCLNDFLDSLPADMPKDRLFAEVAARIDREIHRNYKLYPSNYVALDELRGKTEHADKYTEADKKFFDKYVEGQLAKVQIEGPDMPYLRECILRMYANPAINYMAATSE